MLDCQQGNRELGGFAVNDVREKMGLNPLDVHELMLLLTEEINLFTGRIMMGKRR